MKTLIAPIVNNNGSSKDNLLEDYLAIKAALDEALHIMARGTPNGRDYQTVDPGIASAAREAHSERMKIIKDMRDEFYAIAIEVSKQ